MMPTVKHANFNGDAMPYQLINAYDPKSSVLWHSWLEEKMTSYYDILVDYSVNECMLTPRGSHNFRVGYKDIMYYLSYLFKDNPDNIIDIGCGECIWKDWFPGLNILGVDPKPMDHNKLSKIDVCQPLYSKYDATFKMNDEFINSYREKFNAGMALNSIHFVNSMRDLMIGIRQLINLVTHNGKFLFTLNLNKVTEIGPNPPDIYQWINYLYDLLVETNHDIILFDVPSPSVMFEVDPGINGHVRFILQKV